MSTEDLERYETELELQLRRGLGGRGVPPTELTLPRL